MEDTHTTIVEQSGGWLEIFTRHDQTGSAVSGKVPLQNIPMLIEGLKQLIVSKAQG